MNTYLPFAYRRSLFTRSEALIDVNTELARARGAHKGLSTPHEAIAVIREEYLEAEREVFAKECDRRALRKELVQLAAMCLRAIEDLGLSEGEEMAR